MDGRGSYHQAPYSNYPSSPPPQFPINQPQQQQRQYYNYSYPQPASPRSPQYSVHELPSPEPQKKASYIQAQELPVDDNISSYNNRWTTGYQGVTKPRPHRPAHFYVPPILRLPALLIVFVLCAGLVGLVEYGVQKLPHAQKSFHEDPKQIIQSLIQKRQAVATPSTILSVVSTTKLTTTPTTTATSPGTSIPPTSVFVSTTVGGTSGDGYIPTALSSSTSAYLPTTAPGTGSAGGYVPTSISTSTTIPVTVVTSVDQTTVATDAAGKISTKVTRVASTIITSSSVPTTVQSQVDSNGRPVFPLWIIFVGNYLAILIVVVLRQFWTAIYSQAKLMEPFVLLGKDKGVTATSVLDTFYLSSNITPDPILALIRKHWFVLWTSLVYFAVGFLSPLSSELMFLDTNYEGCPLRKAGDEVNPCWPPRLSVDPVIARAIQGLLAFAAVMTLSILVMVYRTRTGVYSDPSSIASITSLVHHPEVVDDFRMFNAEASMKEVKKFLGDKKYKLGEYQRSDGVWRYGIVPVVPSLHGSRDEKPMSTSKPRHRRWKIINFIFDTFFLLCLLALLGIVAGYYKDSKDDAFNRFFNSRSFGPRFVLTGTGTLIAINWKRIERDAHTLSPYHRMAQSPSSPGRTILLRKSSIPLTSIIPMLTKGHLFVAYTAVIAVLSELLIIFLGAVPYSAGQVLLELKIASYVSMAVLGLMAFSIIALMFWKRRLPDLPRAPDTIAAVVSYVADSRMLDDFEGFEYLDDRDMSARLAVTGKKYVYGKRPGSDGQERYLVDEDTQLTGY